MKISINDLQHLKALHEYITDTTTIQQDSQPIFHRLEEDSTDEGITVILEYQDSEAIFFLDETVNDKKGEVSHWILLPTIDTIQKYKHLGGTSIIIYNE
jgi:hypothetical protein